MKGRGKDTFCSPSRLAIDEYRQGSSTIDPASFSLDLGGCYGRHVQGVLFPLRVHILYNIFKYGRVSLRHCSLQPFQKLR